MIFVVMLLYVTTARWLKLLAFSLDSEALPGGTKCSCCLIDLGSDRVELWPFVAFPRLAPVVPSYKAELPLKASRRCMTTGESILVVVVAELVTPVVVFVITCCMRRWAPTRPSRPRFGLACARGALLLFALVMLRSLLLTRFSELAELAEFVGNRISCCADYCAS